MINVRNLTKIDIELLEGYWLSQKANKKQLKFLEEKCEPDRENYRDWLKRITGAIDELSRTTDEDLKTIIEMRYMKSPEPADWEEISDILFMSKSRVLRKRKVLLANTADLIGWV